MPAKKTKKKPLTPEQKLKVKIKELEHQLSITKAGERTRTRQRDELVEENKALTNIITYLENEIQVLCETCNSIEASETREVMQRGIGLVEGQLVQLRSRMHHNHMHKLWPDSKKDQAHRLY